MANFDFKQARKDDATLYQEWKDNPTKKNMGKLVKQMSGPIYKEVRILSGTLPTEALAAEAKKWAIKAIKTYDPSRAALSTHVTGYVRKAKRLNYQYQNSARLSEENQLKYHSYSSAVAELENLLNREPTDKEVAAKLGWRSAKAAKYRDSLYADHFESGTDRPTEVKGIDNDKVRFSYVMENLTPEEKILFMENKTMSSTDLAVRLKVNLNQLNYMKKKLTNKIIGLQKDIGYY